MAFHKQLENLYLFHLVALSGSFQGAADKVGLPRSSVSKRIAKLEQTLNLRLLERSTRKLSLTQSGHELLKSTEPLQQVLHHTETLSEQVHARPQGKVRIGCSTLMAHRLLIPHIHALSDTYPDICFDFNLTDEVVDLIDNHVDIAIRIGHLPDSSLLARQIGEKTFGWYASPAYLAQNGAPESPESLLHHRCLVFKNKAVTLDNWVFVHPSGGVNTINVTPTMISDDARGLVQLATLGQGIIMVDPAFIDQELRSNELVPVLTDYTHPDKQPIHLVCLGKKGRSRAVTCVWEALSEHLLIAPK
ncbi:LysR family transcriptional regulator [Vibrio coralliilyticus]|uniref:LysR family transcriptional regulator n=1 Tax=Vibrio coralliilyticus TaxID=190893 RepID=UPI002409131D|nr:LysR family transcriptional regulator [Vibrio coralliilyticus]WFB51128.1 LysR family transcriptional regulator [Vibrio coralliilyticus]